MPERRPPTPLPPVLKKLLVVDDEENYREAIVEMLRQESYQVEAAANGEEALGILERRSFDAILCDVRMPDMDGWAVLDRLRAMNETTVVIMMSAYGDHEVAVGVMKRGAYDYISKPFRRDEILLTLKKAEEREKLRIENQTLRETIQRESSFESIISQAPKMLEIFAIIRKISEYKTTVLITGESGTGKELIARALHFNSPRRDHPFVAVNCGAIPGSLLESELFGHVKGAFTDASRDKKGLFELAHTGTLFLDEIGELPHPLQVKLLRALQEEEIRRVGDDRVLKVDVRTITATVRDLQQDARAGRFRDDLYYRLNVLAIQMPALRDRKEDIPLLVEHFLGKQSAKLGLARPPIARAAVRHLIDHNWPGNVRELENVIERAIVLCDGTITPEHLPREVLAAVPQAPTAPKTASSNSTGGFALRERVEELEAGIIRQALAAAESNRTRAAKLLDISHRTLLYKMRQYHIQ